MTWVEHYPEHRGKPGEYGRAYRGTREHALIRLASLRRFLELAYRHVQPSLLYAFWSRSSINACFRVALRV